MEAKTSLFHQFINRDRNINPFDLVTILSVCCLLKEKGISVRSIFWGPQFSTLIKELENKVENNDRKSLLKAWEILSERLSWKYDPQIIGSIETFLNQNSKPDFKQLVDDLFHEYEKYSGKSRISTIQPQEITDLALLLCKALPTDKVYNPFAGMSSYLTTGNFKHFYAQEIKPEIWALSVIRLLIHGLSPVNFKCEDSVLLWNSFGQKYDLIIATPPFGFRIDRKAIEIEKYYKKVGTDSINLKTFEEYVINRGLSDLTEFGKLAIILPTRLLSQTGESSFLRKMLIEKDLLEYVVFLPGNMFFDTSIPTCMVVLNNRKQNVKQSTFVDARNYIKSEDKIITLNNILLFKDIKIGNPTFIKVIQRLEFEANDYDFNFNNYFSIETQLDVPEGYKVVKLGDVLTPLYRIRANETTGRLIKVSNLSNDFFSFEIKSDQLEVTDIARHYLKIESPVILLSKRFNRLKPSYCLASKESPVYIIPEIEAFELSDATVDLQYLISQLNSEFVKKQIESTSSGIMPILKREDLLKIEILIPELSIQKQLIEEAKLEKINELGLEIDEIRSSLRAEFQKDINFRKHAIGHEIFGLKNEFKSIMKIKTLNNGCLNDDMIANPFNNTTIKNCFESMSQSIDNIRDMVKTIDESFYGEDEEIDILAFLDNYCKVNSSVNFKMELTHDYYIAKKDEYIPEIKEEFDSVGNLVNVNVIGDILIARAGEVVAPPKIKISSMSFKQILSNIKYNALKHGFISSRRNDYKIQVHVSNGENDTIVISVSNNGNPLKPGIDETSFFINARQGNIEIKNRVEHAKGEIYLEADSEAEFPVKINMVFPDRSIIASF